MSREQNINFDQNVAIIGGSLVGPVTELLFRSAGFKNVTTYEAASQNRLAGGLIGVDETALAAFNQIGLDPREVMASSAELGSIFRLAPDGSIVSERTIQIGGINTTWDLLHSALAKRVAIRYGKRATGIEPGDQGAKLSFSDNTAIEADLVVFADGRKSMGREHLNPNENLIYQGFTIWRGITEPPDPAPDKLSRFENSETGTLLVVSDPIQQGIHAGKSDWSLSQNLTPAQFEELTGASPETRSYIFPHKVTPEMRVTIERHVRGHLPIYMADMIMNTIAITGVPMNIVPAPTQAVWSIDGKAHAVLLGDALMPVPPQTRKGLNGGVEQAKWLVDRLVSQPPEIALHDWESQTLASAARWFEIGEKRVRANGLGAIALSTMQLRPVYA